MPRSRFTSARTAWAIIFALLAVGVPLLLVSGASGAAVSTVPLGTAGSFAVLAGTGITDVPTSSLKGAVGVSPTTGASITGLTCAEVTGAIYTVDAAGPACRIVDPGRLTTAKGDFGIAYGNAAGRSPDATYAGADNQLGGKTLIPGVYRFAHAATANLIGNLTLKGDASSVWIFQATSDFITAGSSTVTLSGGAQSCNVFWQVATSATLGGSSTLVGTVMAGASITAGTGATISGRLMAQALVSLDTNTINRPSCSSATPGSTPSREIYCDPSGKSYDLVLGQDKEAPYDKLGLVPAYVDPITGAKSCDFPVTAAAAATTTTSTTATTTSTTTTATAPLATPTPKPAKAPVRRAVVAAAAKTAVKHVKVRRAAHVTPKPAKHGFGFTG